MTHCKIDLVYVWCLDDDPGWRAKRRAVAESCGVALSESQNGDCRYRGGDLLRYSLRSVASNAPWIENVFVVVDDDQSVPPWSELASPNVRVVRHSEIIPREFLPTFCSDTIEHHIARIPGLAERFLYANDDMLFWDAVAPSFFFAPDGRPYLRYGARRTASADSAEAAYRGWLDRADALVVGKFALRHGARSPLGRLPHHNVDAYLKSDVTACYDAFRAEIEKGFASPFRNPATVQRAVYSDYAFAIGHGHFRRATFNTNCASSWWRRLLPSWADSLQVPSGKWRDAPALIARFRPKLVCFNDGSATTDDDFEWLREMLGARWPL